MTLVLKNHDMIGLVSTIDCIEAIEAAYISLGCGHAREMARRRFYEPRQDDRTLYYWYNQMAGLVPEIKTMALRIISSTVSVREKRGNARLGFPGAFAGLVHVFDTESTKLIALLQDFYLNPIRVAATSAIVTRKLARSDAKVMGLFGSGTQALLQAECTLAVRNLERIMLYSTSPERRKRVAEQMSKGLGIEVIPVSHPKDAVIGCDIVTTATSSNEPVFNGDWVEKGTHINTMIGSDYYLPRRETDDRTVFKSDIIVVNSRESVKLDRQPELYPHVQRGMLEWADLYEVGELLVGKKLFGRSNRSQITYHNNNVGMGIQFAALGRLIYNRAIKAGRGVELDDSLFTQYDEDLREIRDNEFLGK